MNIYYEWREGKYQEHGYIRLNSSLLVFAKVACVYRQVVTGHLMIISFMGNKVSVGSHFILVSYLLLVSFASTLRFILLNWLKTLCCVCFSWFVLIMLVLVSFLVKYRMFFLQNACNTCCQQHINDAYAYICCLLLMHLREPRYYGSCYWPT